ncbi:DUF2971 domain-containing protein [Aliagarivorans taiwanensis]|uniref:DUF2971 domain-containing protein n=1 Tax=Aliagarivorans taiwanensis TaxID=561966 RepID=UPI00047B72F7|nr:DUF2971 domain-containing protein [Aliagarivorans taiwanensis]
MDTLYHYCSTEIFRAIVAHKKIRLSSLRQSNDSAEGRVAETALRSAVKERAINPDANQVLKDALRRSRYDNTTFTLGFCLSENGDQLSQWRGYADDGHGVSIGFSRGYLDKLVENIWQQNLHADQENALEVVLTQVIYQETEQVAKLQALAERYLSQFSEGMFCEYQEGHQGQRKQLFRLLSELRDNDYTFKRCGFQDEREWRLLCRASFDNRSHLEFTHTRHELKPYIDLDISQGLDGESPIVDVVLGPKHTTPRSFVKRFISREFKDVKVSASGLTYR